MPGAMSEPSRGPQQRVALWRGEGDRQIREQNATVHPDAGQHPVGTRIEGRENEREMFGPMLKFAASQRQSKRRFVTRPGVGSQRRVSPGALLPGPATAEREYRIRSHRAWPAGQLGDLTCRSWRPHVTVVDSSVPLLMTRQWVHANGTMILLAAGGRSGRR